MKHIAPLGFAMCALALTAACSGGTTYVAPAPTASSIPVARSGNVVFLVTVPNGTAKSSRSRQPNIAVPGGTQSVSVVLQSVNGTPQTSATPTTQNLGSGVTGCTSAGNQIVCQFTVSATAGNDVFLMKTFAQTNAGGSATGAGTVSVTAASGESTIAPVVLSGTVASIALSVSSAPLGASGNFPVTISAKDSSGDTILGQYTNAITLTDTDPNTTPQTSLSVTGVANSDDATSVTLQYKGGAMTKAATVSASASGVPSGAVTPAMFMPNSTYPTVNGASSIYAVAVNATASPGGGTISSSGTETQTTATGQTFNGLSNLIGVTTVYATPSPDPLPPQPEFHFFFGPVTGTQYYQWNAGSSSSSLQYVGLDGIPDDFIPVETQVKCLAPYATTWIVPLPASWDALSGSGPCSINLSLSFPFGINFSETDNADGSYMAAATSSGGPGQTDSAMVSSNGSGVLSENETCSCTSLYVSVGTPAPSSSTIPVTIFQTPGPLPSPLPSMAPTTIPNWYANIPGNSNGALPQPLQKDTYTTNGTRPLDASCNVSSTLVPSGAKITEVDETYYNLDPLMGQYLSLKTKWYLVDGIGMVCGVQNFFAYSTDTVTTISPSPDSSETGATTYSLTFSSLSAAMARTHSFAMAYPAAQSGILTAAHRQHFSAGLHVIRHLQSRRH